MEEARPEGIRVLLVEDNPGDAKLVKEMLSDASTIRFVLSHTDRLSTALALLKKEKIDIILLDLSLPDEYGINTVIQTNTARPEVPIVVMSGFGDEELAVRALQEGAQDYLVKGQADSNLLIRSIRYAIERKQAEEALRRAYDELEMRVQERTLELVLTNEALLAEISERTKAEKALQRSEASLAEAQRIARVGNWEWDIDTNKLYWSDEICRIFGLTPQEFGATYEDFLQSVHHEDRDYVERSMRDALAGKPYAIEHRVVLPDGTVKHVREEGEVTCDEASVPVRMFGVVQDITEKKEREMQVIMSERLAALGQMASGIAHEINNPLATIAACSEGLLSRLKRRQMDQAVFEDYLGIISEEVLRCKGITTSMLSFIRKTAGTKRELDITLILDKTLELIDFQGRLKEVKVVKKYRGNRSVRGCEDELKQVFLTLIVNALDSMEDRGTLTIETEKSEPEPVSSTSEKAYIRIGDTGQGIPHDIINRIFDPFFTMKSSKGGTGLGLSIAHKIIKDHNGQIMVSSEMGKGALFTVVLPA